MASRSLSLLDSTYIFDVGGTFQNKIKIVLNKQEKHTTTMGTWQIQQSAPRAAHAERGRAVPQRCGVIAGSVYGKPSA